MMLPHVIYDHPLFLALGPSAKWLLLELNYHGVSEAAAELGSVVGIRDVFIGFQRYLYE